MKVIYEPHPVTAERKAELRQQGYTILDAVFAPDGYVHPDQDRPRRGRPPKSVSEPAQDQPDLSSNQP